MKKNPTFFISSTVYDFADLRSAIKYYLELQGCDVLASEFNDFGQPLDTHSYEACLRQIQVADYFVLLIGSRVGGWYDEANRISITRQEYREAHKLLLAGKLKIITFVRADVWTVKADRKSLSKFLAKIDLDDPVRQQILNAPSPASEDTQFIIDFIEEVGRNKESALAGKTGELPPPGNWIYSFSKFEDVIDTLHAQVFAGLPKEHATHHRLLRNELLRVLTTVLSKSSDGAVYFPEARISDLASRHRLVGDELASAITLTKSDLAMYFMMMVEQSRKIPELRVVERVLATDTFLEYDNDTGALREQPVYEALLSLQLEVDQRNAFDTKLIGEIGKALQAARTVEKVEIPVMQLLQIQALLDRGTNIVRLCMAVLQHLSGTSYVAPTLRHRSPLTDQVQQLERETVTVADVEVFLKR